MRADVLTRWNGYCRPQELECAGPYQCPRPSFLHMAQVVEHEQQAKALAGTHIERFSAGDILEVRVVSGRSSRSGGVQVHGPVAPRLGMACEAACCPAAGLPP